VTKGQWLACTEPQRMLALLRRRAGDRKLRLFAVACCRAIWPLLPDERNRLAVEVIERFADGQAGPEELAPHQFPEDAIPIFAPFDQLPNVITGFAAQESAWHAALDTSTEAAGQEEWSGGRRWLDPSRGTARLAAEARLAELLRCLFGNPFRRHPLDAPWRTPAVLALANHIYEERRFEDMPILADGLEEAGCRDEAVLAHCRGSGPHARGCFVVDALLDKG
jgi:hypothetical protein